MEKSDLSENEKLELSGDDESELSGYDQSNNHIDKLIDLDNINPTEILTSNEVLDNVQLYDSTV